MSSQSNISQKIIDSLHSIIAQIPASQKVKSDTPQITAQSIVKASSAKAAVISGTLGLPPGPIGLLTIIPDLIAVWRLQRQMVSDIASVYGKTPYLTPETMMWCLFKHGGSVLLRDLFVRVGERIIVKRATLKMTQRILQQAGIRISQRVIGKGVARWIPFIGAAGMATYAWYDTSKVGQNAIELFTTDIQMDASVNTIPDGDME